MLAFVQVASARAVDPPRAQLTPGQERLTDALLQPANLSIDNTTGKTVDAVSLRLDSGGPRFVYPLTLPTGESTEQTVRLPPLTGEQTWNIRLLDRDRSLVAETAATIRWPIEWVDPDALVAPGIYSRFRYDLPRWDSQLRTNLLAVGAIATLAMAAMAWMHRTRAQLIGLVVIVAAATGMAGWLLAGESTVLERTVPVRLSGTDANGPARRATVLTARRTVEHRVESGDYVPLYRSWEHLIADESAVRSGGGFTTRLQPDRPMILLIRDRR
jgi:hypothetical protein